MMIHVEGSRVIERPIDDVWTYLSDLDNMRDWDPGVIGVDWERPLQVGQRVAIHDDSTVIRLVERLVGPTRFKVTELEEGRRLGLGIGRGSSRLEAVYALEPLGTQQTRVTRQSTVEGHGPWRLLEVALRRRVIAEREAEVANLKRVLEAGPPTVPSAAGSTD